VSLAFTNEITAFPAAMFILPMAATILHEEEKIALFSLLVALIEARDKEAYKGIRAFVEVFAEEYGTPEKFAAASGFQKDPEKTAAMQADFMEKIEKRIKRL
jgi:hypothetical protein